MQNQRIISYQQAADELRNHIIGLYNKKIFPRMGKIFADQLFLTGMEAGGYLSVLADLDEIHVKRDTAQCALIRLKRVDYILKTMIQAAFFTEEEAGELSEFLKKIIPAVKGLLEEVYGKIDRDNAALLSKTYAEEKAMADEDGSVAEAVSTAEVASVAEAISVPEAESIADEPSNPDPDGFYDLI